mmetsp:Transcript_26961/g.70952  ORF Transcript_26961/g.70952 Transcript_26961/m.70952 type:complete len:202 (-) Transcript_26961:262-867(-)
MESARGPRAGAAAATCRGGACGGGAGPAARGHHDVRQGPVHSRRRHWLRRGGAPAAARRGLRGLVAHRAPAAATLHAPKRGRAAYARTGDARAAGGRVAARARDGRRIGGGDVGKPRPAQPHAQVRVQEGKGFPGRRRRRRRFLRAQEARGRTVSLSQATVQAVRVARPGLPWRAPIDAVGQGTSIARSGKQDTHMLLRNL